MKRLIVAYDIADDRRRNLVAHLLEGFGERVQKSVFECGLDPQREATLRRLLTSLLDAEEDRLRIYPLCEKDHRLALAWDTKGVLSQRGRWVL